MFLVLSRALYKKKNRNKLKRLMLPRLKLAPRQHWKVNQFIMKNIFIILTCLMQRLPVMKTEKLKLDEIE